MGPGAVVAEVTSVDVVEVLVADADVASAVCDVDPAMADVGVVEACAIPPACVLVTTVAVSLVAVADPALAPASVVVCGSLRWLEIEASVAGAVAVVLAVSDPSMDVAVTARSGIVVSPTVVEPTPSTIASATVVDCVPIDVGVAVVVVVDPDADVSATPAPSTAVAVASLIVPPMDVRFEVDRAGLAVAEEVVDVIVTLVDAVAVLEDVVAGATVAPAVCDVSRAVAVVAVADEIAVEL